MAWRSMSDDDRRRAARRGPGRIPRSAPCRPTRRPRRTRPRTPRRPRRPRSAPAPGHRLAPTRNGSVLPSLTGGRKDTQQRVPSRPLGGKARRPTACKPTRIRKGVKLSGKQNHAAANRLGRDDLSSRWRGTGRRRRRRRGWPGWPPPGSASTCERPAWMPAAAPRTQPTATEVSCFGSASVPTSGTLTALFMIDLLPGFLMSLVRVLSRFCIHHTNQPGRMSSIWG